MITTGMKLMLGGVVVTGVAAWVYGFPRGGTLGTTGLISAFVAFLLLAGVTIATRDANVSSMDPTAATESPAARRAPQASPWPLVGALGAVLVVVGLVTYPVVFIFGVIVLLATIVEWMIEAWSERASADDIYNDEIRERIANPAEFPVLAALVVIVIVYSFSRIMLFLSKSTGPVIFAALALLVLAGGFLFAYRPRIDSRVLRGVGAVALVALVAGGVAASIAGEREIHPEETTATLAAEGRCATPDETEADHNASQTVGAKANITAEVILNADGTLTAVPVAANASEPNDQLAISRSSRDQRAVPQRERHPATPRARHGDPPGRGRRQHPARAEPALHRAGRRERPPVPVVQARRRFVRREHLQVLRARCRGPVDPGGGAVSLRAAPRCASASYMLPRKPAMGSGGAAPR